MVTVLAALAAVCFSIAWVPHQALAWSDRTRSECADVQPVRARFRPAGGGHATRVDGSHLYAFVLGLEAVTAFGLSVWLLGESASALRMSGIALVVAGIILLKTGTP